MTQEQLPEAIVADNDQTRARRAHLDAIRALVGNAYPNKFARSRVTGGEDTITAVVEKFKAYEPPRAEGARPTPEQLEAANAELNKYEVRVSGRLAVPPRVMGKAAFVHLSDGRERLQIYVRKDDARAVNNDTGALMDEGSGWQLLQLLDHGDFVGVAGYLFVTKTGELSVHVRELQFLTKALLPMPDKLHGISDPETGRRQRYVDLIAAGLKVDLPKGEAPDTDAASRELSSREVFERRSRLITELRRYLDAHGYVEVETPMLTPLASGAAAKPFETYHNALGIKLYARIAPELYLKRLLVGGFEKVYELNRNFRNEGLGYRWNPEFTMLEFYCAYMDVNGMMDFCEAMLRETIEKATGSTHGQLGDEVIDFGQPFQRLTMRQAIIKYWPEPYRNLGGELPKESWFNDPIYVFALCQFPMELRQGILFAEIDKSGFEPETQAEIASAWEHAKSLAAEYVEDDLGSDEDKIARGVERAFGNFIESRLKQPTYITDFPKLISPLSKASPADPAIAERFELFAAGMEIANGFSELNDPVEQYERFQEQVRQRERGDEEAMPMDEDYIRALAYGMPPAAGIGIGIDRLVMLLTNRRSIRDVILFPHMRPQRQAEEQEEQEES
ncbi:MAG TPA: lysine--tRNA ligase [Pyrinomonadaceae bacterium]|jgi:lysyl-tRNA synthetase class 2